MEGAADLSRWGAGLGALAAVLILGGLTRAFWRPIETFLVLVRPFWWPTLVVASLCYVIWTNDQVSDLFTAVALQREPDWGSMRILRDAASSITDPLRAGLTGKFLITLTAAFLFGLSAWMVVRRASELAVQSQLEHYGAKVQTQVAQEETPSLPPWHESVRVQAARLLGVALPLAIAAKYWQLGRASGMSYGLEAGLFAAAAVLLFLFFWLRRPALKGQSLVVALTGWGIKLDYSPTIRGVPLIWLLIVLAAHIGLLALFSIRKVDAPVFFGAPAVVIAAVAAWLAFGFVIFTYLPHRMRLPVVPLFFIGWVAVISNWNDNHFIRTLPEEEAVPAFAPAPAADYARAWLAERERFMGDRACGLWPVFVVAAEGGGIRAAYWTGTVLGRLERETADLADTCGTFADHAFVVSGVSGGSVGAAAFAAALADGNIDPEATARAFLKRDHLSPTAAGLLYNDAIARFLPLSGRTDFMRGMDRATWMEASWEEGWRVAAETDAFAQDYRRLWTEGRSPDALASVDDAVRAAALADRGGRPEPPALALNTTSVQTGAKWVVGPVRFDPAADPGRPCESGQLEDIEPPPMSLATAAHLSARFTYVSPAARLDTLAACTEGRPSFMRFVDGGYFEESGADTGLEAISALKAVLQNDCEAAPRPRYCDVVIVPLAVTTDPSPDDARPPRFLPELRSPLTALFASRDARGDAARRRYFTDGDYDIQAQKGGERARPDERRSLAIEVRLARSWRNGTPCAAEASGGPVARCDGAAAELRALPLGWSLSQWAVDRMDANREAHFLADGCGAAAAALVRGVGAEDAVFAPGGPLATGRCGGLKWDDAAAAAVERWRARDAETRGAMAAKE